MGSTIDLSEFDPYSPTPSSSSLFSSSSRSKQFTTPPVASSASTSHAPTSAQSTDQDPLSMFSQLELGAGSDSREIARNGNPPPSSSSGSVRAQRERHSKILADLSREPFNPLPPPPPASSTAPLPHPHPTRSHSGFSPPRRLSSLMDLGDQVYPQYPHQFSPPLASSPTLEPFYAHEPKSAARRMRKASGGGGDWAKSIEEAVGSHQPQARKARERTVSGEWGDFQTATPPTPGTTTSSPTSTPEPLPLPSSTSTTSQHTKPSPRRSSTTPNSSSSQPSKLPTSAASLSSYHLKNLPPPPSASSSFDPFNRPVKLSGLKPGINEILSETIAESLRPSLPPRLRISPEWSLLYSLDQHGTSILTLFTQVTNGLRQRSGGFVLVVKTERGQIFGGYVSEAFKSDGEVGPAGTLSRGRNGSSSLMTGNKVWGGDGTSFLFSTVPLPPSDPRLSPLVKVFTPTYHNTYFQHASLHSGIALGGGNDGKFGLWIDERLERGWTGRSETFGNAPLTGANHRSGNGTTGGGSGKEEEEIGKFEIVGVECWAVGN